MKFAYEDLSDDQFEKLVVVLCQRLLGAGAQGFAKGPDGGRDARFIGTAQLIPSTASPWVGAIVVQAKHTNGCNRSFAELDFYSPSSMNTVIGNEVPRITRLVQAGELDHYMLFANRRLTAKSQADIGRHLSEECGIAPSSILLCGVEQIDLWLKRFPDVAKAVDLDPVDSPLIVSPDDLAEVVQALAAQVPMLTDFVEDAPTIRVDFEKKNALNSMTAAYAEHLRRKYLKDTVQIQNFLAAPENAELLRLYESVVDEFQCKIIAKRKDYQTFDDVLNYLMDLLFDRDAVLRQRAHKRLTGAVLFYMYWNCDIGEVDDASANQALTS